MLRVMLVCLALSGFGAAARAGELDREAAPPKPVTAPAAKVAVGTEMDSESPAAAYHHRGYWGGYRGYYGGYRGYGYGRGYYGGYGSRPLYTGTLGWNLAYNTALANYYSYAYPWGNYYGGYYPMGFNGGYGYWW
jgi:hypothetical protein